MNASPHQLTTAADTIVRSCPPSLQAYSDTNAVALVTRGVAGAHDGSPVMQCIDLLLEEMHQRTWFADLFEPGGGKMFGVLLCRFNNKTVYLAGFSGLLAGAWTQPGFVPPVCDVVAVDYILRQAQTEIDAVDKHLNDPQQLQQLAQSIEALAALENRASIMLNTLRLELDCAKQQRAIKRRQSAEDNAVLSKLSHQSSDDRKRYKQTRRYWQQKIADARALVSTLRAQQDNHRQVRAGASRAAQAQVFDHYLLAAPNRSRAPIKQFFCDQLPPSGTGDCAAPKLLHYANVHGLHALSLAEFWVGAAPDDGVRRHAYVYPPCRGKCQPIMAHLLGNAAVVSNTVDHYVCDDTTVSVLYEDAALAVLEKPPGLLSVPGKTVRESVYTQLQRRYPDAVGPLLVHRLDMDTSGILLMAKSPAVHKHLQKQFIQRRVQKQYIAVLDGVVKSDSGEINLPLRVDLQDRPRQLVCNQHGKSARTRYQVLERSSAQGNLRTRIVFYPETGRTHQLRVHAAHVAGLNAPVVGDPLYGNADKTTANRMYLHASYLGFQHPSSGESVSFQSKAPF